MSDNEHYEQNKSFHKGFNIFIIVFGILWLTLICSSGRKHWQQNQQHYIEREKLPSE